MTDIDAPTPGGEPTEDLEHNLTGAVRHLRAARQIADTATLSRTDIHAIASNVTSVANAALYLLEAAGRALAAAGPERQTAAQLAEKAVAELGDVVLTVYKLEGNTRLEESAR